MLSRISRRGLAALILFLLLPSLSFARPQAQTARRPTPTVHSSLIDLLPTGLVRFLAKVLTSSGGTTTPPPAPTPAPGDGSSVRIDPDGAATSPAPAPVGHP